MSTVIKSGEDDLRIRCLGAAPPARPLSEEALRIRALEVELREARAQAAALRAEADRLGPAVAKAREEGRDEGMAAGRREAEDRSAALVELVSGTAAEGLDALRAQVAALADMAGGLAAAALERVVLDPDLRREMVLQTARRAVEQTFADAVVKIEVSSVDFPDPELVRRATPPGCETVARDDLPSGACRLVLRMGEADLDLHGQVVRLRAVLQGGAVA